MKIASNQLCFKSPLVTRFVALVSCHKVPRGAKFTQTNLAVKGNTRLGSTNLVAFLLETPPTAVFFRVLARRNIALFVAKRLIPLGNPFLRPNTGSLLTFPKRFSQFSMRFKRSRTQSALLSHCIRSVHRTPSSCNFPRPRPPTSESISPPVVVAVFLDRWTSGRGGLRDAVDVAWQIGIDLFDI